MTFCKATLIICLAHMLLVTTSPAVTAQEPLRKATKKLIEFGWDEPDTAFMRRHIAEMEKSPFDGCVFHVNYASPTGQQGSFTWGCWGERAFNEAELKQAIEDLKATPFNRFTHSFLRFNTTPAKLDWFDDHAAVLNNARLAARIAREGRCAGVLFDIEQYEGQLFNYRKQRDAKAKSWDTYAVQVRLRGRQVMEAFQEGYPGLTVFLTFGHSLPFVQAGGKKEKLPDASYGLLAPFLDGMIEAARDRAKLVDGHELSYGYKEPGRFEAAYRMMSQDVLPIVSDVGKYRRVYSFGFGIWMDHDQRKLGWNSEDPSKNYFTPELLEGAVRKAMQTSDEYVWVYTEIPRWWSDGGGRVKLPQGYADALARARRGTSND